MNNGPMPQRLDGKTAIVTGAAQGIGEATVRRLTREGARVLCVDLNEAVLDVARVVDGAAQAVVVDVADTAAFTAALKRAESEWGRVDILVNNAGIDGTPSLLAESGEADFDRVIDVNLKACWAAMRAVLSGMAAVRAGSIVNVSSVAGLVGFETLSIYAASKSALLGMTRSAALEYGPYGVRVNAVCPGGVMTPLARSFIKDGDLEMWSSRHALKRFSGPEEIASVIAFLASEDASFITGAVLPVDGGMTAH